MLLLASGLRFMGGFTLGVWIVPFYREAFPGEIGTEFALLKAAVNGVAGSVSAIGGVRDRARARARVQVRVRLRLRVRARLRLRVRVSSQPSVAATNPTPDPNQAAAT